MKYLNFLIRFIVVQELLKRSVSNYNKLVLWALENENTNNGKNRKNSNFEDLIQFSSMENDQDEFEKIFGIFYE